MNEINELKNIPQELKMNALWCYWKLTENGKVPLNPRTEAFAKSNDETTFAPYMVLLNKLHNYWEFNNRGQQIKGIGLGVFRGYSAIDIDHCVDENGEFSEMAKDIIEYCNSYTELSPSKTGIRIIFRTNIKINKQRFYIKNSNIGLEIYISNNTNRFVTMTGNAISNKDTINEVDITYILDRYMRKQRNDLNSYIAKDRKLNFLWNSVAPGSHANESETDASLCCKLAFYLKGDLYAIKQAFECSPYYNSKDEEHKKKWEREDYWRPTIEGAISYCGNQLDIVDYVPTTASKLKYNLDDTGNARRFADKYKDDVRYNVENKKWMLWNGMYWEYDVKDQVRLYAEILTEQMEQEALLEQDLETKKRLMKNVNKLYNAGGKDSLLSEAMHIGNIPVTNNELDNDNNLLCCLNGVVDLITGELLPHKKQFLQSQCTCCSVDLENKPKKFLKFLEEILCGNKEMIEHIQKVLGYSLTGTAFEQCMFILLGEGNDGKSLLLDTIRECVGTYGIVSRPTLLTEQRNGTTNLEEIARLKGKRFVFCEETKQGERLDESVVKSLTSGIGNMVARFLYGNSFEFDFKGVIFMASNHKPVIRGTDKGIWRRIKIEPFTRSFKENEVDKDLKRKLLTEKAQILGWLVEGCLKYRKEGLGEPEIVKLNTSNYREEMDIVAQWFNERCMSGEGCYAKASDLFKDFNAYCIEGNQKPITNTMFGREISKKFKKKVYNGCNVYIGLCLKHGTEDFSKRVKFDSIEIERDY